MYETLKSIVKKVIPQKFLIENEQIFRKFLVPFYSGNQYYCNVCDTKLKNFARLHRGDNICPICGSLPRTRRLNMLLESEFLKPNFYVLDFSPFRMMYRKLKQRKDIYYFPTDFENEFLSDYSYDITKIDSENEKFDLIICYHVLEHIIEDEKAMKELYRVLKPQGKLLVQTPFKEGETYEDEKIISREDRLKFFGQEDHVRIYSAKDLEKRLKNFGFTTEIRTFSDDQYFGFSKEEKLVVCSK